MVMAITAIGRFYPGVVHPFSQLLMLSAPYVMGSKVPGLAWEWRSALVGIFVSFVILVPYSLTVILLGEAGWGFNLPHPPIDALKIIVLMFFVALSEEVFFRGYLQEMVGMNVGGVVKVSLLFALAHVVSSFLGLGLGASASLKTLLTFFPSLVMGFMYLKLRNLWASIIFHFFSNLVYIATGGL